ncbi:MAG: hypothetical protein ABI054_10720 [Planctomycetota bacterium]
MKIKLLVLAVVLLIAALAILFATRPSMDELAEGRAEETSVDTSDQAELLTPLVAESSASRVAVAPAEATQVAANAGLTAAASAATAPTLVDTADLAVIEVIAQDEQGQPLGQVQVNCRLSPDAIPRIGDRLDGDRLIPFVTRNEREAGAPDRVFRLSELSAWTTSDGHAEFRIQGGSKVAWPVQILLTKEKLYAKRALQPPLVSTRIVATMILRGRVEVSLFDATGRPVQGAYVDTIPSMLPVRSDERGVAVFDELVDGEYEFKWFNKAPGTTQSQSLQIEMGKRYFVELRMPTAAEVPVAVSGMVVDESGNPLPKVQLRARVDGGEPAIIHSNDAGAFSHSCAAGREVELTLGGGMWDDDYAPSSSRVPFGTKDLRFQRTRTLEVISVEFEVLDATSGEAIKPILNGKRYRAGRPTEIAGFSFANKGNTTLLFRDHADWHVVISAFGYLPQDLTLAHALQRDRDHGKLAVRLERGPDYEPSERKDQ